MGKQRIQEKKGLAQRPKGTRPKPRWAHSLLAHLPGTGLGSQDMKTSKRYVTILGELQSDDGAWGSRRAMGR